MKTLVYQKIDAFTAGDSMGNPAACVYLNDEQMLTEDEMLGIAKQHKGFVSEVVYCKAKDAGEFDLVYYSSECEVPFCGHGTIACAYSLVKGSPEWMKRPEITIHTRTKGSLVVHNRIAEQDAVFISAPEPLYLDVPVSREMVAVKLGVDKAVISGEYPIEFIDAGNRTLIVPVVSLEDEINIFPDERVLREFTLDHGIDVVLLFCEDVKDASHFMHTRVFAAKYGYLEDPATGSANSAFGYYLLKNKMWGGEPIMLEQGGRDRVFNTVHLLRQDGRILFGGKGTVRVDGVYYI